MTDGVSPKEKQYVKAQIASKMGGLKPLKSPKKFKGTNLSKTVQSWADHLGGMIHDRDTLSGKDFAKKYPR